jgi:hypothetical protein
MQDYNSIINNMNRMILVRLNKIKIVPDDEREQTIGEYMGTGGAFGFSYHYGGDKYPGQNDGSPALDVDSAGALDKDYTTYRPHYIKPDHMVNPRKVKGDEYDDTEDDGKGLVNLTPDEDIREQDEDVPDPDAAAPNPEEPLPGEEAPEEPAEPDLTEPGFAGGEPGMGEPGLGGVPGVPGVPGQEEPKNPTELGRTYEMKKIYARLVSMNDYLSDEMSPKILKTKRAIAKAIDLFAVIGANPDSYMDRIDEIIVSYYKFLKEVYKKVKTFYRSEALKAGLNPLENNLEQNDDNKTEVKT